MLIYKADSTPVGRDDSAQQERRNRRLNAVSFYTLQAFVVNSANVFLSPFSRFFFCRAFFLKICDVSSANACNRTPKAVFPEAPLELGFFAPLSLNFFA
jgi:hypothetical protein